ncbi:MAG: response regulator [Ignavibacteriae bacterium]|nr:response regulator [Ignavibacteriota bacterium]
MKQKNQILIVEDDPAIQKGLKEMLELENFEVLIASDGKDGYELAMKNIPVLILLDINLPSMSGLEVCRKLRENNFLNPVIMLTSRSEQIDKILGLELGANDYITKPFDSRELLARIHSQLRSAERISHSEEIEKTESADEKPVRKLLAVMFTDIKDYSKKMGEDEILAIKLLDIHNEIIEGSVKCHEGKVVEIIGDAFLVTFNSALRSVECAYEIQKKMKSYNEKAKADEQIEVRIGIHLGDVFEYGNNIKGDAVNIAARIQQSGIPGGVTISEGVFTAIKNKVDLKFSLTGEHNFKNIKEPVTLYVIEM